MAYLSGPPLHHHRDQVDTFYILESVLKVQVEDEFFDLGPGNFASVAAGVRHTFDNVRVDQPPVMAINLMVPGGLDLFLEQLGDLGEQPAEDDVNRVGARNGVTFVGPTLRVTLGLCAWLYKHQDGPRPGRAQRREQLEADVARLFAFHEGKYGSPPACVRGPGG